MRRIRVKEKIDHRYLGALRMIDRVTGSMVKRPLHVRAAGLKFFPNRSYLQVVSFADGLAAHLAAFEAPPDEPDARSLDFTVSVEDPLGEYLDRSAAVALPLVPTPGEANSLFNPIDITLFAAPAAHVSPNWSIIRASIYDLADMAAENPIAGALLRVVGAGDQLLMSGMSDQRGEAAVIIPGIPITTFSLGTEPDGDPATPAEIDDGLATGSVIETATPVTLEIIVSPATPWPADPSEMEDRRNDWRRQFRTADSDQMRDGLALELKTGKTQSVKLFADLT
jgi:hypothetical protein